MAKKIDYRALSSELDELLAVLQSADSDIDTALQAYTRGMTIIKDLEQYLKDAENKVIKIRTDWEARTEE